MLNLFQQSRNAAVAALKAYAGSADHLNTPSPGGMASSLLSRSMHALEMSSYQQSGLPSYRPSPDYDTVMRERSMHAHAYMPEAYDQQQAVRALQNGLLPNQRSVHDRQLITSHEADF